MTTTVAGALAPGVSVDVDTFVDLTTTTVTAVAFDAGLVVVTFDGLLDEGTTRAVIRRISLPPAAAAAIAALEQRVTALENPA